MEGHTDGPPSGPPDRPPARPLKMRPSAPAFVPSILSAVPPAASYAPPAAAAPAPGEGRPHKPRGPRDHVAAGVAPAPESGAGEGAPPFLRAGASDAAPRARRRGRVLDDSDPSGARGGRDSAPVVPASGGGGDAAPAPAADGAGEGQSRPARGRGGGGRGGGGGGGEGAPAPPAPAPKPAKKPQAPKPPAAAAPSDTVVVGPPSGGDARGAAEAAPAAAAAAAAAGAGGSTKGSKPRREKKQRAEEGGAAGGGEGGPAPAGAAAAAAAAAAGGAVVRPAQPKKQKQQPRAGGGGKPGAAAATSGEGASEAAAAASGGGGRGRGKASVSAATGGGHDHHHGHDHDHGHHHHHAHGAACGAGCGSTAGSTAGGEGEGASAPASAPAAPPPSSSSSRVIPASASQAEIMASELREGAYECTICFDAIAPLEAVWSCDVCYRVLHLGCTRQWREKLGAVRGNDPWRCPGCQTTLHAAPVGRCFCGKTRNPEPDPFLLPHSCGRVCGRHRGNGCPHRCTEPCHPGPCPPCLNVGPQRRCGCGRNSYQTRCGAPDASTPRSCGRTCGKPLACGSRTHRCEAPCHTGPCAPCGATVLQACYCGVQRQRRPCGSGVPGAPSRFLPPGDGGSITPRVEAEVRLREGRVFLPSVARPKGVGGAGLLDLFGGGEASSSSSVGAEGAAVSPATPAAPAAGSLPVAFPLCPDAYLLPVPSSSSSATATSGSNGGAGSGTLMAALLRELTGGSGGKGGAGEGEAAAASTELKARLDAAEQALVSSASCPPPPRAAALQLGLLPSPAAAAAAAGGDGEDADAAPDVAPLPPPPAHGHYSCGGRCRAWLDCGVHRCPDACHPGDCRGCPSTPGRLSTCGCGRTPLTAIRPPPPPRASCLDPVPSCGGPCGCTRPCGHACTAPCHGGACPPCTVPVPVSCRCTATAVVLPCDALYACVAAGADPAVWARNSTSATASLPAPAPGRPSLDALRGLPVQLLLQLTRCTRPCGKKLSCSRHKCARVCCPLAKTTSLQEARAAAAGSFTAALLQTRLTARGGSLPLATQAAAAAAGGGGSRRAGRGGGGSGAPSAVLPEEEEEALPVETLAAIYGVDTASILGPEDGDPPGQRDGHVCSRVCGRGSSCRIHTCDAPCHAGVCPPCGVVDPVRPLVCPCGRTRVPPPIRCGTSPPVCPHPCRLPRACGHPHPVGHACHPSDTPCGPCVYRENRLCAGGHEVRLGVPCHVSEVTCPRPCGKKLPCGVHACGRVCHSGPCLTDPALAAAAEAAAAALATAAEAAGRNAVAAARIAATVAAAGGGESVPAVDEAGIREAAVAAFRAAHASDAAFSASCGGACGRQRSSCPHPGSHACHGAGPCPPEADDPCRLPLTILCACGRLAAEVDCQDALPVGGAPEGGLLPPPLPPTLPCDDLCLSLARTRQIGLALGLLTVGGSSGGSGGGGEGESAAKKEDEAAAPAPGASGGGGGGDDDDDGGWETVSAPARSAPAAADKSQAAEGDEKKEEGEEAAAATTALPAPAVAPARRFAVAPNLSLASVREHVALCPYPDALLAFAKDRPALAAKAEKAVKELATRPEKAAVVAVAPAPAPVAVAKPAPTAALAKLFGKPAAASTASSSSAAVVAAPAASASVATNPAAAVQTLDLPFMDSSARGFVHQLAALWGLESLSHGEEPDRFVRLTRRPRVLAPSVVRLLAEADGDVAAASAQQQPGPPVIGSSAKRPLLPSPSSIGCWFLPGRSLILPSMGLADAVATFAAPPPSSRTSSTAAAASSTFRGAHPTEPHLSAMDPDRVGRVLHAFGLRRSTRESELREALLLGTSAADPTASFTLTRLDDHNALLLFESKGRAARALAGFRTSLQRGLAVTFRVRYWGIGVEEALAAASGAAAVGTVSLAAGGASSKSGEGSASANWRTPAAGGAVVPPPLLGRSHSEAAAWSGAVAASAASRHASMAAAGLVGVKLPPRPAPAPSTGSRFRDALGDGDDEEGRTPAPSRTPLITATTSAASSGGGGGGEEEEGLVDLEALAAEDAAAWAALGKA